MDEKKQKKKNWRVPLALKSAKTGFAFTRDQVRNSMQECWAEQAQGVDANYREVENQLEKVPVVSSRPRTKPFPGFWVTTTPRTWVATIRAQHNFMQIANIAFSLSFLSSLSNFVRNNFIYTANINRQHLLWNFLNVSNEKNRVSFSVFTHFYFQFNF